MKSSTKKYKPLKNETEIRVEEMTKLKSAIESAKKETQPK